MSNTTTIRDDDARMVKVDGAGFIVRSYGEHLIGVALTDDQRKAMAAALDPDRVRELELEVDRFVGQRDRLAAERDEAKRALANVEATNEALRIDRDRLRRAFRNATARADTAEARVRELVKDRDTWRDRANHAVEPRPKVRELEKAAPPRPEVTKDDIMGALMACRTVRPYADDVVYVAVDKAADAMCGLIHPEPEPVDPVEALAEALDGLQIAGTGGWFDTIEAAQELIARGINIEAAGDDA